MKRREAILNVSDLQAPFMHPDTVCFLTKIKKKYGPFTMVVMGGDEIDNHALNDYENDPDGLSHGPEIVAAVKQLAPIYALFPCAIVLKSNHVHGRLERRRRLAGLSTRAMASVKEMIGAPKGWQWVDDLTYKTQNGRYIYWTHGMDADGLRLTKSLGMSTVQFHYHTKYGVQFHSTPHHLNWSLQCGCSVDIHSPALKYSKKNKDREVIGHAIIENGWPRLLPMPLNKNGRWTGEVP